MPLQPKGNGAIAWLVGQINPEGGQNIKAHER